MSVECVCQTYSNHHWLLIWHIINPFAPLICWTRKEIIKHHWTDPRTYTWANLPTFVLSVQAINNKKQISQFVNHQESYFTQWDMKYHGVIRLKKCGLIFNAKVGILLGDTSLILLLSGKLYSSFLYFITGNFIYYYTQWSRGFITSDLVAV